MMEKPEPPKIEKPGDALESSEDAIGCLRLFLAKPIKIPPQLRKLFQTAVDRNNEPLSAAELGPLISDFDSSKRDSINRYLREKSVPVSLVSTWRRGEKAPRYFFRKLDRS